MATGICTGYRWVAVLVVAAVSTVVDTVAVVGADNRR